MDEFESTDLFDGPIERLTVRAASDFLAGYINALENVFSLNRVQVRIPNSFQKSSTTVFVEHHFAACLYREKIVIRELQELIWESINRIYLANVLKNVDHQFVISNMENGECELDHTKMANTVL
jgi:hypothetical protein